jgi:hypothetical protein
MIAKFCRKRFLRFVADIGNIAAETPAHAATYHDPSHAERVLRSPG